MKDLLKYGLIGAGALYFFKDQLASMFGGEAEQPPAAPAPAILPAPAGPAYQQPPAYTPPAYIPPAPTPQAVNMLPVTDDLIKKASWDAATAGILGTRVLLNIHEWNWYHEHSGGGRQNPGTDFGQFGDPNVRISANEYLARRQQAGLSGLGRRRLFG